MPYRSSTIKGLNSLHMNHPRAKGSFVFNAITVKLNRNCSLRLNCGWVLENNWSIVARYLQRSGQGDAMMVHMMIPIILDMTRW